jgi:phosphohistidine phosphatase
MKKLILMRHAKAARHGDDDTDEGRPLHRKGIAALNKVGAYLQAESLRPNLIVHSNAKRTTETAFGLCDHLDPQPMALGFDALYLAASSQILNVIHGTESTINCLMVVGHNPGIADLALDLNDGANSDISLMQLRTFPTSAVAVFQLDIERWSAARSGYLSHYIQAGDLT